MFLKLTKECLKDKKGKPIKCGFAGSSCDNLATKYYIPWGKCAPLCNKHYDLVVNSGQQYIYGEKSGAGWLIDFIDD